MARVVYRHTGVLVRILADPKIFPFGITLTVFISVSELSSKCLSVNCLVGELYRLLVGGVGAGYIFLVLEASVVSVIQLKPVNMSKI